MALLALIRLKPEEQDIPAHLLSELSDEQFGVWMTASWHRFIRVRPDVISVASKLIERIFVEPDISTVAHASKSCSKPTIPSSRLREVASRTCWSCGVRAHQTLHLNPMTTSSTGRRDWMAAFRCDECGVLTIGLLENFDGPHIESGFVKEVMEAPAASLTWFPARALGKDYPDVPDVIAGAASEAHSCHSIGSYRSAVLMARAVIEATAKDQGVTSGRLADKIDEMANRDLIRPLVQDQAHEIRHLGNDMAHGDFVTTVTEEESDEILALMGEVLNEVYQAPARLEARKQARVAKAQQQP